MRLARFMMLRAALVTTAGVIVLAAGSPAWADSLSIDFENPPYTTGSIDGQDGWSGTGADVPPFYDYEVAATSGFGSPAGFGAQSFRISNAVTSGSFGDWAFSRSLNDEAGEPGAANGGYSGGTRRPHYEVSFDIAAADPSEQPGLQISVSPDRGDGARMSFLEFRDTPTGLAVDFVDYRDNPPYGSSSNLAAGCNLAPAGEDDFVRTTIASGLSRSVPHHVKLVMDFVPGPRNDAVRVFIDGNVVNHCGTSWEDYFRYCEATDTSRTVDSLLLQARTVNGTAAGTLGKGFLVDNLHLLSGPLTTPPEVCPAVATPCAASACASPNCLVNDSTGSDVAGCCTSATPCKTIQFAVGDANVGDAIAVAAGNYTEPAAGPLNINKTVTLCGAKAGVDARTRSGAETHIADPLGTIVSASDVVIDGFTVEGNTSSIFVYGIDMAQGTTGTQAYNNIIQNNIAGIGLANTGVSQVRICQNLIQNNNNAGSASGTGIYTDQYVCGNVGGVRPCSDFLIDDNAFAGNTTAGIDISDDDPTYAVTNIEVSTNAFDSNGRGVVLFNADSVSIHNNDITNSTTAGSGAIRLQGGSDGVSITNNNLDGGAGWAIRMTNAVGLGPSTNVVIHENNIANFAGDGVGPNPGGLEVTANAYSGTLDAECNWWDDPCGPYNVQDNPTGPGEEVRDPNGNVDFISWLIAPGPAPASGSGTCTGAVCAVASTTTTTSTTGSSTTSTTFPCTEPPETACSDMQDNDCDGKVDCADPDCNGISPCPRIRKDPSQVRFGPPGGLDVFQSHGKVDMPQVDLSKVTVGWLLSKSTGVIYRGRLNPGDLVASPRGTSFRFRDRAARSGAGSRNGIYFAKIKKVKDTGFAYSMRAYGDFSAATDAAMSIQFYAGERVFITSDTWTQIPTGWRAPKDH